MTRGCARPLNGLLGLAKSRRFLLIRLKARQARSTATKRTARPRRATVAASFVMRADALVALGEVLLAAGDTAGAHDRGAEAARLYEAKGMRVVQKTTD